ncbi:MAG TPA: small multi-drug export protein [Desulfobacteria bacterium]|nr:small multi-drug export protein [Desulfobacteria bacterium]
MIKEMQTDMLEKANQVRLMNKIALLKLLLPFAIAGATVAFLWFFFPEDFGKYATVFGVYSFVPLIGTVTVVPTGLQLGIPPVPLIAFIIFTDAVLAMFLVWNFDYAKKVPGLGKLVQRVGEQGEQALQKYKWAKRFGFIGVVFLVIFPLQWTGSGVGSIVGRLIGMQPLMTWLAVVIGTFIRSTLATLIYYGAISFF